MAVVGASTSTLVGWRVPAELKNGTLVLVEVGAGDAIAEAVGCQSSANVLGFVHLDPPFKITYFASKPLKKNFLK